MSRHLLRLRGPFHCGRFTAIVLGLSLLPTLQATEILPAGSEPVGTWNSSRQTITTVDGTTYENVQITRVEADGLILKGDAGITKVPFEKLSEELQKANGYDPEKAAAFKAENAAIQAQVSQNGRAARAMEEERKKSELAAIEAEKQERQKDSDRRTRIASPSRIKGTVLQATKDGLLVKCEAAGVASAYGMQSVGGGGGPKKTSNTADSPRPKPAYGIFLVVGHPKQNSLADKTNIDVDAYEDGLFTYVDTTGAQRRVKKFVVIHSFQ